MSVELAVSLVTLPVLAALGWLGLRRRQPAPRVEIDDVGVRRWLAQGAESVDWGSLVRVEILTTDEGPMVEDVWWLLHRATGGVAVPGADAGPLLQRLGRLPRVSHEQVILAMGSTEVARFLVWEGEAGEAQVCGAP